MPSTHLTYGGSTATRTLMCPNWVNIAATAPPQKEQEGIDARELLDDPRLMGEVIRATDAASRGTILHEIMEAVYDRDEDLSVLIEYLPPEDQVAAQTAYRATESLFNAKAVDDYVCEQLVTLSDDEGGSADVIACSLTEAIILDYKFGRAPVPDRNQMKLYALAAQNTPAVADMMEGRRVLSAIVQPAISELPLVAVHEESELRKFRADWDAAVALSRMGGMTGNPGDHCKYCPGAAVCPAKREQVAVFVGLDPKYGADLATAMALVQQMRDQIKAVEAATFAALERGQAVPGWKLVLKRTTRRFKDLAEMRKKFRYNRSITKDMYLKEPELKSVKQVEDALKLAGIEFDLGPFIDDSAPGTTIAPEDDKRPAVEVGHVPDAINKIMHA